MLFLSLKHQKPICLLQAKLILWSRCGVHDEAWQERCWNHLVLVMRICFDFPVFTYNAADKETCERNHGQCSPHAFCTDYTTGFCCHCQSRFYGNGKHCLPEGKRCWLDGAGGCSVQIFATCLFPAAAVTLLMDLESPTA